MTRKTIVPSDTVRSFCVERKTVIINWIISIIGSEKSLSQIDSGYVQEIR